MTYSRICGIDQADCAALVCSCANEPHTPTQAEREAFWADEPVRTTPERSQAGRSAYSKPGVTCFYVAPGIQTWDVACGCGWIDIDLIDWPSAMDAAHAHVREHHTPRVVSVEPVHRRIVTSRASDGTVMYGCSVCGGLVPEDVGLPCSQSARLTVTYTRDDPDPSTEAWRELLATSREDT